MTYLCVSLMTQRLSRQLGGVTQNVLSSYIVFSFTHLLISNKALRFLTTNDQDVSKDFISNIVALPFHHSQQCFLVVLTKDFNVIIYDASDQTMTNNYVNLCTTMDPMYSWIIPL